MFKAYKGYSIYPHDYNSMGLKYYAYSIHGGKLRANTLKGIKELITLETKKEG